MKIIIHSTMALLALSSLLTLDARYSTAFAQGSLTPPGGPAPTMKSLDQIEPRTGITNLPVTLVQGGSYYLTKSFAQAFTTNAITIISNNVTLDLCGFTITQTGAGSSSGISVRSPTANAPLKNVLIKDGSVVGFSMGVSFSGARYCLVEQCAAIEGTSGITFQGNGTATSLWNIVRQCRAAGNAGAGIAFLADVTNDDNTVEDCDAFNNATGFDLASINNLIIHCRSSGNTTANYFIAADNDMGTTAEPIQNSSAVNGSKGGSFGIGVTDPFSNLSYP